VLDIGIIARMEVERKERVLCTGNCDIVKQTDILPLIASV
jgi:hypothetical protein